MNMWRTSEDKFDALSQREKVLTLIASLTVLLLVGFTYGVEPQIKQKTTLRSKMQTLETQQRSLQLQLDTYQQAVSIDPDLALNDQLAQLKQKMSALEQQFADELQELIPPDAMPALLDDMLSLANRLELQSLASLPAKNIFAAREDMQGVALYQHGVRLIFKGNFDSIVDFVAELETSPWRVYWSLMDYEVLQHPDATLTLEFYTLSTEEAIIRV